MLQLWSILDVAFSELRVLFYNLDSGGQGKDDIDICRITTTIKLFPSQLGQHLYGLSTRYHHMANSCNCCLWDSDGAKLSPTVLWQHRTGCRQL